jgi:hypothetical protein
MAHLTHRVRVIIGWAVFGLLAVLTLIEYLGAIWADQPMLVVGPAAAAKAALIVWFFMHIGELFATDPLAEPDEPETARGGGA